MNTRIKTTIAGLITAAALIVPAAASAHVTLQPDTAPAGAFERLDVRVPNEEDDAATTKVEVEIPDGIIFLSTEPVAGWETTVKKEKLDKPIEAFGEEYNEQIATVTFEATGPGLQPGEFQDFGLSLGLPDAPDEALTFPAIQTYDNGDVVRWVGPEDADEPAPIVTLTAAEGHHGSDPADEEVAPAADVEADDEGSDTLAVIALIVGGLGLLAGLWAAVTAAAAAVDPSRSNHDREAAAGDQRPPPLRSAPGADRSAPRRRSDAAAACRRAGARGARPHQPARRVDRLRLARRHPVRLQRARRGRLRRDPRLRRRGRAGADR